MANGRIAVFAYRHNRLSNPVFPTPSFQPHLSAQRFCCDSDFVVIQMVHCGKRTLQGRSELRSV